MRDKETIGTGDPPTAVPRSQSQALAAWALALRYADAPPQVQQTLQNCVVYNLAMALAVDENTDALGQALRTVATAPGPARLFGGRGSRSAPDAAFINASLVTARGQNDTHPGVVTHIGCIVLPAVLAVADLIPTTPRQLLDALLVGYETIPRVAAGLAQHSTRRGFRASALFGPIGAALASAVLLGLNREQAHNAVSMATHTASGLLQTWADGSQEWRFQMAKASRDGVQAALLAQAGVVGSRYCLEGDNGFGKAYAGVLPELDFLTWYTPDITFKPYPGCAFNQAPVQALRDLLARRPMRSAEVGQIVVYLSPADASYPGVAAYGPFESPSGAIMSAPFMLAMTLLEGLPQARHFARFYSAGEAHALSRKIRVQAHADVAPWLCSIKLTTASGEVLRQNFKDLHAFELSREQTQALASQVSEEWPTNDRVSRFSTLIDSVQAMGATATSHAALAALQHAVYTRMAAPLAHGLR